MDSGTGLQKLDLIAVEMCEEFGIPYVVSTSLFPALTTNGQQVAHVYSCINHLVELMLNYI